MDAVFIIILSLVGVGAVLYLHYRLTGRSESETVQPAAEESEQPADQCCGQHLVCERDTLSPDMSAEIEYFDDEELDAYIGFDEKDFSAADVERFRDVLLTLRRNEIPAWARSVQQRGITLPADVRDELFLLVSEQRYQPQPGV